MKIKYFDTNHYQEQDVPISERLEKRIRQKRLEIYATMSKD